MRKLAMISQPMGNKSEKHIKEVRAQAMRELDEAGFETLDTYLDLGDDEDLENAGVKNIGAYYLGESIKMLAKADIVYFVDDWWNAKGCRLEERVAVDYGITRVYATKPDDRIRV